jgi:hypothetical protein
MEAILLPQAFQLTSVKSIASTETLAPTFATVFILRSIVSIHTPSHHISSSYLTYSSLSLFLTQQSVLSSYSCTTFAQQTRREFYSLFEQFMTHPPDHKPRRRSGMYVFKRRSRLNGSTPSPWLFGQFIEEGRTRPGLGHEAAIEAGSEVMQATPPVTAAASTPLTGVVVQKSVMVMVRDKDMLEESSRMSCSALTNTSENELENILPMNDSVVWADICFKGIVRA